MGHTNSPSNISSLIPSLFSSGSPSAGPSALLSNTPSTMPTNLPSVIPTSTATSNPTSSKPKCADVSKKIRFPHRRDKKYHCSQTEELNGKHGENYCDWKKIKEKCPVTCGMCNTPSLFSSVAPTNIPSTVLSIVPSVVHTNSPSNISSLIPSLFSSGSPSAGPSTLPSGSPSAGPSDVPSTVPSITPSTIPSIMPSSFPSVLPSILPSKIPSNIPSTVPSADPSIIPSNNPSSVRSTSPSAYPSALPSDTLSTIPSVIPSTVPSSIPSKFPSTSPSISLISSSTPSVQINKVQTGVPILTSIPSILESPKPSLMTSITSSNIPTSIPILSYLSDISTVPSSSIQLSFPTESPSISLTKYLNMIKPTSSLSTNSSIFLEEKPSKFPSYAPNVIALEPSTKRPSHTFSTMCKDKAGAIFIDNINNDDMILNCQWFTTNITKSLKDIKCQDAKVKAHCYKTCSGCENSNSSVLTLSPTSISSAKLSIKYSGSPTTLEPSLVPLNSFNEPKKSPIVASLSYSLSYSHNTLKLFF